MPRTCADADLIAVASKPEPRWNTFRVTVKTIDGKRERHVFDTKAGVLRKPPQLPEVTGRRSRGKDQLRIDEAKKVVAFALEQLKSRTDALNRRLRRLCEDAGVHLVVPHSLRGFHSTVATLTASTSNLRSWAKCLEYLRKIRSRELPEPLPGFGFLKDSGQLGGEVVPRG